VCLGDIIHLSSSTPSASSELCCADIPADCVILAIPCSEDGIAYVETANLDGETNLKLKSVPSPAPVPALVLPAGSSSSPAAATQDLEQRAGEILGRLRGEVRTEMPNDRLYTFDGTLYPDAGGGPPATGIPLHPGNLLLRGCTLRRTASLYAVVVFSGHDTKLLRNAHSAPIKKSRLELSVNTQIWALFGLLFTIAIAETLGLYFLTSGGALSKGGTWYLLLPDQTPAFWAEQFVVFLILFNTIIPIRYARFFFIFR
jgi:phospholipid-transporting ATPase